MKQLSVTVARKVKEAEGIASFELVSAEGKVLPPFSAGSHIDVEIRPGLTRQYSLCNDPTEQHRYLIAVLRDPHSRGGSAALHDVVREGDTLAISEPKNHFPLVQAKRSLLFAGGIGVTPILCMAERLAQSGNSFEMHYCSRSAERTAFRKRITLADFASQVSFHYDDGTPEQKLDLTHLLARPQAGTHLYVCGPSGFIDFIIQAAKSHGWQSEQLHLEYFGALAQDTSADRDFQVKIASSGVLYTIPAGKPVIEVLASQGVNIPVSCEQGVCGTCATRVLDGVPEHRDVYLTDAERARNDQFMPCCSRSKSPMLVLDL
ncbi:MAG: PDR/VanB family oxidoreductase [Pseudomonadota bacterium]